MTRAFNIDCMTAMAEMEDNQFDLAIVDPPYFDGPNKLGYYGQHTSREGIKRKDYAKTGTWDIPKQDYYSELTRVSKHKIIWGINYFEFAGAWPGRIIWDKVNDSSTFSDCEIALCSMIDTVRIVRYMWNGMLQGKSISEGSVMQGNKKLNERRIHPTQKPVILYKWMLSEFAKEGDSILDTHLGSGSSRIAAHDMGFDFTGYEIDKYYFAAQELRFKNHSIQSSMFTPNEMYK